MQSRIHESDKIINTERKFGADPCYYPALLVLPDGEERVMLFTNEQINVARHRASFNPEECEALIEAASDTERRIGLIILGTLIGAFVAGAVIVAVWP